MQREVLCGLTSSFLCQISPISFSDANQVQIPLYQPSLSLRASSTTAQASGTFNRLYQRAKRPCVIRHRPIATLRRRNRRIRSRPSRITAPQRAQPEYRPKPKTERPHGRSNNPCRVCTKQTELKQLFGINHSFLGSITALHAFTTSTYYSNVLLQPCAASPISLRSRDP